MEKEKEREYTVLSQKYEDDRFEATVTDGEFFGWGRGKSQADAVDMAKSSCRSKRSDHLAEMAVVGAIETTTGVLKDLQRYGLLPRGAKLAAICDLLHQATEARKRIVGE